MRADVWDAESLKRLASMMGDVGFDTERTLDVRPIGDGHSNLTFLVEQGSARAVVRRPPPPPFPRGAHDVLRETVFLRALERSAVPVPRVLATAAAGEVADVPLYVMDFRSGPIVTSATPPETTAATRRTMSESLVDVLAALHGVNWEASELQGFGRPVGFNGRHLSRIATLALDDQGVMPERFSPVFDWLSARVPAEAGAGIVHNDYRIGNVVFDPSGSGVVSAVLDWELSTIGDPLMDLGYFLVSVPIEGETPTPTGEFATAMLEPGFLSRDEFADRYLAATGRSSDGLGWYMAFALWKLAALYDYSGRRPAEDRDPYYDEEQVDRFLEAAAEYSLGGRRIA